MAGAPAALLLRPVPSLEQQPSVVSVSSASLVSSSSSFSLFLHHRRPQSFRFAISRITQVQQEEKASLPPTKRSSKNPPPWQQKKASNVASNDKPFQNPPPWQKKSFDEALVDDSHANASSFRPAPWQQGSRKHSSSTPHDVTSFISDTRGNFDSKPAQRNDAAADKSAMARIVEKLRTIQKTYDPADSVGTGQTVTNDSEEGVRHGQRMTYDSRESASFRPSAGQRMIHDQSDHTRTGQTMTPHNQSDRAKTWQKATGDSEEGVRRGQRMTYDSREHASFRPSTGQRMIHDRSDRTRTGQTMTPHNQSDRARTLQKATGSAATETPPFKFNTKASVNGNGSSTQAEISVSELESEASKFPWERDEKVEQEEKLMKIKARGPRVPSLAELTLSPEELKRLRILGLQLPERLKVGKLGVTRSIIISIQEQFTTCELVKVRCEGPAAANIKKTHLEIEGKTGGLVVLRTGKIIVVYRGRGYNAEQSGMANVLEGKVENSRSQENGANIQAKIPLPDMGNYEGLVDEADTHKGSEPQYEAVINEGHTEDYADSKAGLVASAASARWTSDLQAKREADLEAESILEGLGPRFENWTGLLPIPIDADLLPPVISNYRPPFRLMPYGVKPRLSDAEVTDLRRRARPLAPHFVLGRNRGHHGLAAAIVKLWEKSEIAKLAVKKRVQNSNNLIMSDELKRLTGGVLLSRDKFFITLYRGKDFVPEKVASALVEREASVRELQELEEKVREERSIPVKWTSATKPSMAVIGQEAPAVEPSWVHTMDIKEQNRLKKEVAKLQRMTLARKMEKKLLVALKKKEKAKQDLQKVEVFMKPLDRPIDVETITEEERFMFRKIALKMKAYLLVGRRGVFDGVVENMHLHWKHRELVKILVKEVDAKEVQETARMLEYESGGVLVAVTLTKKGQAIIMYRGKNYQRPTELRPRNLLTKRKALKRSLELQRHESLSKNIKALEDQIGTIQAELRKLSKADYEGSQKGLSEGSESSHQDLPILKAENDGLLSNEQNEHLSEERKELTLTRVMEAKNRMPIETEVERNVLQDRIKKLERLVSSGPIYQADRLTNPERLRLRKEALSSGKAPQFFVGKNNGLEGLARGIRIHFLHHDLAVIVVKGRSPGVSMEDLVHDLEELTGGVLVSQEANKIIMYRGWPEGEKLPAAEGLDNLTPELLSALEAEEDWEEDEIEDYLVDESEDSEAEHEDDRSGMQAFLIDSDSELESEEFGVLDEGNEEFYEQEDGEEDNQRTQHAISDRGLKLNGSAEEEEYDDEDDEEEEGDEDSRWDLQGQLDDSAEEEEEEDEEEVEVEDVEEDEDDVEEDEGSDQDIGWDFENSDDDDDDDTEDSDSELFLDSVEESGVEGINGKLTGEAREAW